MITWPWQWWNTGPAITESGANRIHAAAAARGEMVCIDARIIPDPEPEAGQ
jgi:hypothetical protein